MKYKIEIKSDIIQRVFGKSLLFDTKSRGNFFQGIRRSFKEEIENLLIKQGVQVNKESFLGHTNLLSEKVIEVNPIRNKYNEELGIEFCSRYGHDYYSLSAINYIDREYCELPSLFPFLEIKDFSIGNIAILVENGDYDIEVNMPDSIKIVGYSYHISSRKRKSYLCLFGIRFKYESLQPVFKKYYKNCNCKNSDLDEISIGIISYPIIFICRKCGQLFTCKCFENYFTIKNDTIRLLPYGGYHEHDELRKQVKKIKIRDNICHLCTNGVPKLIYGSDMYYSSFLQKYRPYYDLLSRKRYGFLVFQVDDRSKGIENELRERFEYPKIGEKWISETTLFKIVKTLFSNKNVIHHYRGKELEGLEIDIWITDLKLGIEYQGEQHFKMIEHWGGEEGLKKRIESDRKKKVLCKKLGYNLIEFKYNEDLTVENVERKLRKYLGNE